MFRVIANIVKTRLSTKDKSLPTQPYAPIGFLLEKILKHEDRIQVKKKKIGALTIFYKRPYELLKTYREIFGTGIYYFKSETEQPVIIDCGANIGLGVLYFKQLFPMARMIAFEPDAGNRSLLQQNIAENKLSNIEVKPAAIWVEDGNIGFSMDETEASKIEGSCKNFVKCIDFKQFLQTFTTIDFLKIDIEGAELAVLRHCAEELHRVKYIFLEFHGYTSKPDEFTELLNIISTQGFTYYIRNAADSIKLPFDHQETEKIFNVQLNLFLIKK